MIRRFFTAKDISQLPSDRVGETQAKHEFFSIGEVVLVLSLALPSHHAPGGRETQYDPKVVKAVACNQKANVKIEG